MILLQNNHTKIKTSNKVDRKVFEKGELITSFERLPFCTKVNVKKCLDEIKRRHPETKEIYLTGSHVVGLAKEDSDYDFMVLPKVTTHFEFEGIKVDLIPLTQREKIILIGGE